MSFVAASDAEPIITLSENSSGAEDADADADAEPSLNAPQEDWQAHVTQCLDGLGDELRKLARMPGQLDKIFEELSTLNSRCKEAVSNIDDCGLDLTARLSARSDTERNALARQAAGSIYSIAEALHKPLIGGGFSLSGLCEHGGITQGHGDSSRSSGPGFVAAKASLGPGIGTPMGTRMGSRIPSAVPSRVQSRIHSRRPSMALPIGGGFLDGMQGASQVGSAPRIGAAANHHSVRSNQSQAHAGAAKCSVQSNGSNFVGNGSNFAGVVPVTPGKRVHKDIMKQQASNESGDESPGHTHHSPELLMNPPAFFEPHVGVPLAISEEPERGCEESMPPTSYKDRLQDRNEEPEKQLEESSKFAKAGNEEPQTSDREEARSSSSDCDGALSGQGPEPEQAAKESLLNVIRSGSVSTDPCGETFSNARNQVSAVRWEKQVSEHSDGFGRTASDAGMSEAKTERTGGDGSSRLDSMGRFTQRGAMSLRLSHNETRRTVASQRFTQTRLKIAWSGELEQEAFEDTPLLILMPNSPLRIFVDFLTILAIMCSGFIVPIAVAYRDIKLTVFMELLMHVTDVQWIVFMAVNFATAHCQNGEWVLGLRGIWAAYLRTWLLLDLLAASPLAAIRLICGQGHEWMVTYLALKMLRVARLNYLLSKLQKWYRHPAIMVLRVGVQFVLLVHMLACGWRVAFSADDPGSGAGISIGILYVQDLYWLIMTFTTVGYGDIFAQGTVGRIFAMMAMFFAPAFFGGIVSLINHGAKKIFNDEVEIKVAQAIQFMQKRRVHRHLQRRVEQNFRHQIGKEHQMTMAPDLFRNLSPAVQRELSLELLRTTVLEFPLFANGPRPFVAEIAGSHSWVQCLPWDLVVEQGQVCQEVVFLIQGRLIMQCFTKDKEFDTRPADNEQEVIFEEDMVEEQELEAGAWIGEKCLFEDDRIRTATGIAAIESELAVLNNSDFHRILSKYPPLFECHRVLQAGLYSGELDFSDLEYQPPNKEEAPEQRSSLFGKAMARTIAASANMSAKRNLQVAPLR